MVVLNKELLTSTSSKAMLEYHRRVELYPARKLARLEP